LAFAAALFHPALELDTTLGRIRNSDPFICTGSCGLQGNHPGECESPGGANSSGKRLTGVGLKNQFPAISWY
jgi:hypothetical protein